MRWGISGAPIPGGLPFAAEITKASASANIPPCLMYAIKTNESGNSHDPAIIQDTAVGDLMPDGSNAGHGIFQLTSSWPVDWADPLANAVYAARVFVVPAITFWNGYHQVSGDNLVRAVAASFNAGIGGAWDGHVKRGDVDAFDTDHYGARALAHYHRLIAGQSPF